MTPPASATGPKRGHAPARPASPPQGRAIYRSKAAPTHPEAAHPRSHPSHAARGHRARVPSAASGLTVARRRVRETPWDSAYWIELADLLYKRGEFDLATRAYRRVQELCSFGPVAHRGRPPGPQVPWIGPGRQLVAAPSVVAPLPAGLTPESEARVPILRSASGRTRAIRLVESNILVALTLDADPTAPAPTAPSPPVPSPVLPFLETRDGRVPLGRRKPALGKVTADDKLRSVLQKDLERVLKMLEKDSKAAPKDDPPSDPPA